MSNLSPLKSPRRNQQAPAGVEYSPNRLEVFSRFSSLDISNTPASQPTIRRCRSTQAFTVAEKRSLSQLSRSETSLKRRRIQFDKIKVFIRKRPLNEKEVQRKERDIVNVDSKTVHINAPRLKFDLSSYADDHSFNFDGVFSNKDSSESIYQQTTRPLVEYMFNGGKSTIFAYGQTGSGKTYTMLNPNHGLYTMAAKDIFHLLSQPNYNQLTVYISYYEIYQTYLYDLLNHRNKLTPRVDHKKNVVIANLKEFTIKSYNEMMEVLCFGNQERTTGKTGANETSSRSHAVLSLILKSNNKEEPFGKLNFIDLAGSERASDRGEHSDSKTKVEGAEINKSLLALKECIRALSQNTKHPPFRSSKLTLVLRDSFIGNSRTCMIATIAPNISNSEHTLNTLRYADRLKELKEEVTVEFIHQDNSSTASLENYNNCNDDDAVNDNKDNDNSDDSQYKNNNNNNNNNSIATGTRTATETTSIVPNIAPALDQKTMELAKNVQKIRNLYENSDIKDQNNKTNNKKEEEIAEAKDMVIKENNDSVMKNVTKHNRITRSYIRHFTYSHRNLINQFELYLDKSKQLEKNISLLFNSTDLYNIPKLYIQYQRDLNTLLNTKRTSIKQFQNKIEQELEDE